MKNKKLLTSFLVYCVCTNLFAVESNRSVIIVSNKTETKQLLRSSQIPFNRVFTISREEAEQPKQFFQEYISSSIAKESNHFRLDLLNEVSKKSKLYTWYCSGFSQQAEKLMLCELVADSTNTKDISKDFKITKSSFPWIMDGGSSVCFATFSLSAKTFKTLWCNGMA